LTIASQILAISVLNVHLTQKLDTLVPVQLMSIVVIAVKTTQKTALWLELMHVKMAKDNVKTCLMRQCVYVWKDSLAQHVLKLKMHVLVTHVVIRDNAKLLAMYVMCAHAMMALLAITVK